LRRDSAIAPSGVSIIAVASSCHVKIATARPALTSVANEDSELPTPEQFIAVVSYVRYTKHVFYKLGKQSNWTGSIWWSQNNKV
jgi:hypothetical protein